MPACSLREKSLPVCSLREKSMPACSIREKSMPACSLREKSMPACSLGRSEYQIGPVEYSSASRPSLRTVMSFYSLGTKLPAT